MKTANQICYLIVIMFIIPFDWQEKIGNSRGQTCEDIFISCKSPMLRSG